MELYSPLLPAPLARRGGPSTGQDGRSGAGRAGGAGHDATHGDPGAALSAALLALSTQPAALPAIDLPGLPGLPGLPPALASEPPYAAPSRPIILPAPLRPPSPPQVYEVFAIFSPEDDGMIWLHTSQGDRGLRWLSCAPLRGDALN
ncbi:MAG TPA: hypothetical protein VF808_00745 [Ktedonobacterales bacterium]